MAKPATSVYLRYLFENTNSYSDNGEASVILTVEKSHPSSFFCAIQFPPSGYCGLQELEDGRRVVIFSVWDKGPKGGSGAQAIEVGDGFQTSRFGGEGEGCKVIGDFDWTIGESLKFTLKWQMERTPNYRKYDSWLIQNWVNDIFVSTIRFNSGPTANRPVESLLSFIEDFDRRTGRRGFDHQRKAFFREIIWPEKGQLDEVRFSYVEDGLDAFGLEMIESGHFASDDTGQTGGFFISTGGLISPKPKNNNEAIWKRNYNQ